MAIVNLGNGKIRIPDYNEQNWHLPLNQNFNILSAINNNNILNYCLAEGINLTDNGSGVLGISEGIIFFDEEPVDVTATTKSIINGESNYIYIDKSGIVYNNAVFPTIDCIIIAYVENQSNVLIISKLAQKQKVLLSKNNYNYFVNPNLTVNQNGVTSTTANVYLTDLIYVASSGSTKSVSIQSIAPGDTTYKNTNSKILQYAVSSVAGAANYAYFQHRVHDLQLFDGKDIVLSFDAKADAIKDIAIAITLKYGTGGSTNETISINKIELTSTKTRKIIKFSVPSLTGKTINSTDSHIQLDFYLDAGSNFNSVTDTLGQKSGTYQFNDFKFEVGKIATPCECLPLLVEKLRCQRFYNYKNIGDDRLIGGFYYVASATSLMFAWYASYPEMIKDPTPSYTGYTLTNCTFGSVNASKNGCVCRVTTSTATTFRVAGGILTLDARL